MLAYLLFMLVAFSAGGIVSGGQFRRVQLKILDLLLFALPGAGALSAVMVLHLHGSGGSARCYGWYGLPLVATVHYIVYLRALVRQARHGQ